MLASDREYGSVIITIGIVFYLLVVAVALGIIFSVIRILAGF